MDQRQRPPGRSSAIAVLAIAAVPLVLHLATAGNYGIFRDEYYYLACARHLAWGYVDHPPLSIAVLAVLRGLFDEGLVALRLVPALCAFAAVLLVARLAARLGGGGFARVLAALAMAIVSVVLVISGFYSMNALDILFWIGAWLLLAAWAVDPAPRRMILLGLLLGLGLMNKIGLLVFGAALAIALPFTPLRRALMTPAPYVGAALAFLIFLPHVVWQITHGWPTLEFMRNAQEHKITAMAPLAFLGEIVLEQQPANLLVWTVGLGWLLFAARARQFRLLGLIFVAGLALLIVQHAKPYYAAGFFPVLFAAGACAWEELTTAGWRRWLRPALVVLLAASGIFFLPLAVPLLPVETYARWQVETGIAPAAQEVGHTSELPQHYSDRFGWEELAAEVERIVATLPSDERDRVVVLATNYGEAGALEYWRDSYNLPPVVSGHNNYALWCPEELALDTVIVVGWGEESVGRVFEEYEQAGEIRHQWALENGTPIWVGRGPKITWPELRERIRFFV